MSYVVETEEYKGHTIEIKPDECAESPRCWDNLCEFHCWHRRMNLGDKDCNYSSESDRENLNEKLREAKKNNDIVLSLYIYQHSGVALSLSNDTYPFNDRWDAGQVGFVIIRRKEALKEWGKKILTQKFRAKLLEIAEGEVQTYNQYLRGDIYGYIITENESDEDVESCWGFYGVEEAMKEGKSVVDCVVDQARKAHQKKLKTQIKHKVPLELRTALNTFRVYHPAT